MRSASKSMIALAALASMAITPSVRSSEIIIDELPAPELEPAKKKPRRITTTSTATFKGKYIPHQGRREQERRAKKALAAAKKGLK